MCNVGGGGDRGPQADKHLPLSAFTGKFWKESRHLGFGVFIVIWSMDHVEGAKINGIRQRDTFSQAYVLNKLWTLTG